MHVDREGERRDEEQRERPPVDGEIGEADERADRAHGADETGEADRRGVELEHQERDTGDEQEVGDRRADRAGGESGLRARGARSTTSWFGWRRRSRPSPTTLAVDSVTSPAAVVTVLPSSSHDHFTERRPHTVRSRRRRARPSIRGACRQACVRRPGRGLAGRRAPRADHRPAFCVDAPGSSSRTGWPGPAPDAGEMYARCAASSSTVVAPLAFRARRTDPHHDRNLRTVDGAHDFCTPASIAPDELDLQHDHRRVRRSFASAIESRTSVSFGGSK